MFRVQIDGETTTAELTDENPETVAAVRDAAPVEGDATRWGDELYFGVPVDAPPENATERVPVGAVAYWSRGNAICLFWGSTPASEGDEPRAASPVNVFARMDDVSIFDGVKGGAHVRVEPV